VNAWSRDHEGPPACAERPTLRPPAPAPDSSGLPGLSAKAAHSASKAAPVVPLWLTAHDLGVLPAPGVRAARVCSRSSSTASTPSEPTPTTGLDQPALAAFPGARELTALVSLFLADEG
jgi:hypothetical protein